MEKEFNIVFKDVGGFNPPVVFNDGGFKDVYALDIIGLSYFELEDFLHKCFEYELPPLSIYNYNIVLKVNKIA